MCPSRCPLSALQPTLPPLPTSPISITNPTTYLYCRTLPLHPSPNFRLTYVSSDMPRKLTKCYLANSCPSSASRAICVFLLISAIRSAYSSPRSALIRTRRTLPGNLPLKSYSSNSTQKLGRGGIRIYWGPFSVAYGARDLIDTKFPLHQSLEVNTARPPKKLSILQPK